VDDACEAREFFTEAAERQKWRCCEVCNLRERLCDRQKENGKSRVGVDRGGFPYARGGRERRKVRYSIKGKLARTHTAAMPARAGETYADAYGCIFATTIRTVYPESYTAAGQETVDRNHYIIKSCEHRPEAGILTDGYTALRSRQILTSRRLQKSPLVSH